VTAAALPIPLEAPVMMMTFPAIVRATLEL
jgi:hypothetical protein